MFKIGDRVIIRKSDIVEISGIVSKLVENRFYKVSIDLSKNESYYIRKEENIRMDKQWYREEKLKQLLVR